MFFVLLYISSFYLVLEGMDWFMVWVGLEINMMMFIMIMFKRYNMLSIESCFKYFFIQSLGSAVFMSLFYMDFIFLDYIMFLVFSMKVGAGPFFVWFPSVCMGISWFSCFILMTIQKILPLILISIFISSVVYFVVILSLLGGVFGSFNQLNLKQLMAYSSVYHLGWILMCISFTSLSWVNYLFMYVMLIFPVIFYFKVNNVENLLDIPKMKSSFWLMLLMLSMAGMPPFLGFFLKWFAFNLIIKFSMFFMFILIFCSVVMFYVYFRIVYDVLMMYCCVGFWSSWFNINGKLSSDMVCLMGMLFGIVVGCNMLM